VESTAEREQQRTTVVSSDRRKEEPAMDWAQHGQWAWTAEMGRGPAQVARVEDWRRERGTATEVAAFMEAWAGWLVATHLLSSSFCFQPVLSLFQFLSFLPSSRLISGHSFFSSWLQFGEVWICENMGRG
jgi:hypothetical protein